MTRKSDAIRELLALDPDALVDVLGISSYKLIKAFPNEVESFLSDSGSPNEQVDMFPTGIGLDDLEDL